jgi:hypothetical protein
MWKVFTRPTCASDFLFSIFAALRGGYGDMMVFVLIKSVEQLFQLTF